MDQARAVPLVKSQQSPHFPQGKAKNRLNELTSSNQMSQRACPYSASQMGPRRIVSFSTRKHALSKKKVLQFYYRYPLYQVQFNFSIFCLLSLDPSPFSLSASERFFFFYKLNQNPISHPKWTPCFYSFFFCSGKETKTAQRSKPLFIVVREMGENKTTFGYSHSLFLTPKVSGSSSVGGSSLTRPSFQGLNSSSFLLDARMFARGVFGFLSLYFFWVREFSCVFFFGLIFLTEFFFLFFLFCSK